MKILHVYLTIKEDQLDAFRELALYNAANAVQEPGCARFEVLQSEEEPTRFMLIEHYVDDEAVEAHRQTAHFKRWAETILNLQSAERTRSWWRAVEP